MPSLTLIVNIPFFDHNILYKYTHHQFISYSISIILHLTPYQVCCCDIVLHFYRSSRCNLCSPLTVYRASQCNIVLVVQSEYMYCQSLHRSMSSYIRHSYHMNCNTDKLYICCVFPFPPLFCWVVITLASKRLYYLKVHHQFNISALQLSFTIPTADCCISYCRRLIVASSIIATEG